MPLTIREDVAGARPYGTECDAHGRHLCPECDADYIAEDLAARFRELAGDCTKCAVRDANCCVLAECPFLAICPVRPAENLHREGG